MTLKNRFVMAPMGSNFAEENGPLEKGSGIITSKELREVLD